MADRLGAAEATADAERASRRITLSVARRIDGLLHGDHLGLLPGHGSEPADSREYVPGLDDVRRMDWAVTARTTVPHVRDLIADRELETTIVVDLSPSMTFGTAAVDKRELAAGAVATVAMMTLGSGNRVGAVLAGPAGLQRIPAAGGRAAVLGIVRRILLPPDLPAGSVGYPAAPSVPARPSRPVQTARPDDGGRGPVLSLAAALDAARAQARRRGLVVVVSDFLDPPAGWLRSLRGLGMRHTVLAVEVGDPREDELPDVGTVVLADPETGRSREVTLTAALRRRYAAAATARHAELARTLRAGDIGHVALRTDRDWVRDLARFALTHRRAAHAPGRPAAAGAGGGAA